VLTSQIGLEHSKGLQDTYVPGTVPERLYKRAQLAHDIDDDGVFVLSTQVFAATAEEIASVEAEVNGNVLTNAIEAVRKTVRPGIQVKPSFKVIENQA
jgi:hypothetical protein